MGSILNGIALHGLTRPYGGTFLVFSDYMRPAVRLAAIMGLPVTYVWTHDSIGLGEDGPTHQPVEHLAALRAIPGLDVVRPADANETAVAWRTVLEHHATQPRPAGMCLTPERPHLPRDTDGFASADGVARGAYVLLDSDGQPDVVLIGTGSEVQLAVAARDLLAADGVAARVVSMPCREWFLREDQKYRDDVLRRRCALACRSKRQSPRAGASLSAMPGGPSASSTSGRRPTTRPFSASSGSPPRRCHSRQGVHRGC